MIVGYHTVVRHVGSGRFWCLYCETDREYERRDFKSFVTFVFVPLFRTGGCEFVLCLTCDSAFDLECLDESSTALCHELMIQVPDRALYGKASPDPRRAVDGEGGDRRSARWIPEPEPTGPQETIWKSLSARSATRRH